MAGGMWNDASNFELPSVWAEDGFSESIKDVLNTHPSLETGTEKPEVSL
jgi:hypothetical protein